MSEDEVKWVYDATGRFRRRPWYSQAYLDRRAEEVILEFLTEMYGHVTTPVPTGALVKLSERDARELNLYADLHRAEHRLLGMTDFEPPKKPVVQIDRTLYEDAKSTNRFRFTLAHEYMHVHIHNPLYNRAGEARRELCTIDETLGLMPKVEWLESLWSDRLRFAVCVDYAADRTRAVAQSYRRKVSVDEAEVTIRRAGCTC
jgi:hypothetical protein